MLVKIIFWPGNPINGTVFGLLDGADDGVIVKNKKLVAPSLYWYLTDFCVELFKFAVTGVQ